MTRRAIVPQADIRRAIRAARAEGMRVTGYDAATGRVMLSDEPVAKAAPDADADPFMEGLANVPPAKKGARHAAS